MNKEIPLEEIPRPCPKCGSTSTMKVGDTWGRTYSIKCARCGHTGKRAANLAGAVKAWNAEARGL